MGHQRARRKLLDSPGYLKERKALQARLCPPEVDRALCVIFSNRVRMVKLCELAGLCVGIKTTGFTAQSASIPDNN